MILLNEKIASNFFIFILFYVLQFVFYRKDLSLFKLKALSFLCNNLGDVIKIENVV
jgi:hypothetical protein